MTIVKGVSILAAPCCGARYRFPRYASMNFSAFEHWTDGWREGTLMPNDTGLRRCGCGRFLLLNELVQVDTAETSDLAQISEVPDHRLPECIEQAPGEAVEVAARIQYWQSLNHRYRKIYREHRDAEEAATRAAWEAAQPARRSWWNRLMRRKAPGYLRPPGSPFTFPAFEPTDTQLRNMQRLSEILSGWGAAPQGGYRLELAELYREQGRFDEARRVMSSIPDRADVAGRLIAQLIEERETAPMRYRM